MVLLAHHKKGVNARQEALRREADSLFVYRASLLKRLLGRAGSVHDAPDRQSEEKQHEDGKLPDVVNRIARSSGLLKVFEINRASECTPQSQEPKEKSHPLAPLPIIKLPKAGQQSRQECRECWPG